MTALEQRVIEMIRWDIAQIDREIDSLETRLCAVLAERKRKVAVLLEYERNHSEGDA
ncbi:hypothetical protein [Paenibacillus sp. YN15]|uniref:hypothetical protein n=1 Tax=Paenibacillus sp. YN15 TaxID=1742774 RepID=UPI0015EB6DF0|nr:hypothetical protein [Paenibacillus sp. YN15]